MLRQLRYYSTPQADLKLWVRFNGDPSTQVSLNGCIVVQDFAERVSQEIGTNHRVALFPSLDKEAFRPELTINEFLKTESLKDNTAKSPLFIKLILKIEFTDDEYWNI